MTARIAVLVCAAALAAVLAGGSPLGGGAGGQAEWAAHKAVSDSNLAFTRELFKVISKKPGNLFFSPTSIHVILSMTSQGARGDTAQELVQGLHLPADQQQVKDGFRHFMTALSSNETVATRIANKIFTDSQFTVNPGFLETATRDFHSGSEAVDFRGKHEEARAHINSWVMDQTENKISDLLPSGSVGSATVMVLVNALYFKGAWAERFGVHGTSPMPFHVAADETKQVPMMYQFNTGGDFAYTDSTALNAEILEIPYEGGRVSMMIILPKEKHGLPDVEARLAGMTFSDLMAREVTLPHVHLYLPKFRIEHPVDLTSVLGEMGISTMFTSAADLSGLVGGNQRVKVSKVLHKAFIDLDEEGTEAAAATAVIAVPVSEVFYLTPPPTITFKADHPFLFLITMKESGPGGHPNPTSVLFMGRFQQPV